MPITIRYGVDPTLSGGLAYNLGLANEQKRLNALEMMRSRAAADYADFELLVGDQGR